MKDIEDEFEKSLRESGFKTKHLSENSYIVYPKGLYNDISDVPMPTYSPKMSENIEGFEIEPDSAGQADLFSAPEPDNDLPGLTPGHVETKVSATYLENFTPEKIEERFKALKRENPLTPSEVFQTRVQHSTPYEREDEIWETNTKHSIQMTILGEPQAQQRHRTVIRGTFRMDYDPSADAKKDFLKTIQDKAPLTPFDCPIMIEANFYFGRPKSHYRTGKNAHLLKDGLSTWVTGRPDIDNLFKFIMDAMNKIFWRDDSLVCNVILRKCYDAMPRIEITVTPM